jgi:metal-sulfur cluster biosynthetic enzyme
MTTEKILEALSNVQEPDLGKDLVTLNMVKDIEDQWERCIIYRCANHTCLPFKRYDRQCLCECDQDLSE